MIRHICMFKLKEENKAENLAEMVKRADSLRAIPQIKRFAVEVNAQGMPDSNYDIALIFDFESAADLDSYQVCDTHIEFAQFVGSVRESRACIDYEF